ncbi:MAG TPA: LLM class flavin-dependent oxidoreductase [Chloroflexia bacterium]|nr:LLM class flavin-dependent oxidoreductase [Chloroflexia bacterium]
MSDQDVTFGWVIYPVPRANPAEPPPDPNAAARALMEANERYIREMQPHFDTVWVEDHFQWDKRPVLEAVTTLSYLAGRHERVRFGHIVLGQSYRSPSLTAKMAANLQLMTGGRYIMGIGAGWKEDEYRAYGYEYPSAGERIDQLEETVQIMRAMWTESPATFHGKHYHIDNAECSPMPDPPIPLLIAGGGEKKTLRVVAKYADWWNYNFCDAEEYAHKQRVLADHCRDVGRDPSEIVHTYYGFVQLTDDPSKMEKRDFHIIGGTADAVTRELEQFVRLGVRHIQLRIMDFPSTDGLQTLIEKVLPRLRG